MGDKVIVTFSETFISSAIRPPDWVLPNML